MSKCQNCNAPLEQGATFCRYCGHKQAAVTESAPPAREEKSSLFLKYSNYLDDNSLYNVAYAKESGMLKCDFPNEPEVIYEHLALKGHTESMFRYAMIELNKQPADAATAQKWLKIAADNGHTASINYLKTMAPVAPAAPAPTQTGYPPTPSGVMNGEQIFDKMQNATVEILAIDEKEGVSCASGFVVSDKGFIVTNAHAILDRRGQLCKNIAVKLGDKAIPAVPVAYGSPTDGEHDSLDIALLFVPDTRLLDCSDFGESSGCKNGQKVYLIGNSLGCGTCITSGIISDAHRRMPGLSYTYIMTDAAANPGNSGGPLLNEQGEVIGVLVSGMDTAEGMNYAIPIDMVKEFFRYLSRQTRLGEDTLGRLAAPSNTPVTMSAFSDNLFKGLHLVLDIVAFILSII